MHVALVYNLKKEDSSISDSSADPSPSSSADQKYPPHSSINPHIDAYAEWDTMETIGAVRDALAIHHKVDMIEADEFAYEKLRSNRPDIVFNIAEGKFGPSREAQIPAILEMLDIPYTGSDPLTLAICLDKSRAKEILSHYSIPNPRFYLAHSIEEIASVTLSLPCMVKPLYEGSSKGIFNSSLVTTNKDLYHQVEKIIIEYHQPALIEEFLPGREFTVALIGNGDDVQVLPIVEIKFDSLPADVNHIYSYEAKWIWDQACNPLEIFECPAKLTESEKKEIERVCLHTYRILRCRDWSRIDVRMNKSGKPHIIEINPLPGILPNPEDNSCFPKAARAAGLDYQSLINKVLEISLERQKIGQTAISIQSRG